MEGLQKLPKHIGFIIDGNGRWAKQRGLSRSMGHKAGIKTLELIIKECFYTYGIPIVSIYAFSTENWNRPQPELDFLFASFKKYVSKDFIKKYPNAKLNIMGDYTKFPNDLAKNAAETIKATEHNTQFILNLCINYGGKDELVRAMNNILESGIKKVDEHTIENHLYSCGQPPLDFVVRTSGEQRLSNFMLWQLAYAELYFPKTYWPDFKKKELRAALFEYQSRDRRFGAITE